MLLRLHHLALRLRPLRHWCLVLALVGIASAALALMDLGQAQSLQLRASLLFALWMLMLYSCIHLFQHIPSPVLPGLSWWDRVGQHLQLWAYKALAVGVGLAGLALVSLSFKLWLL